MLKMHHLFNNMCSRFVTIFEYTSDGETTVRESECNDDLVLVVFWQSITVIGHVMRHNDVTIEGV